MLGELAAFLLPAMGLRARTRLSKGYERLTDVVRMSVLERGTL
jgi:hypothetical protein